ncbi:MULTISPECIES: hypothetical protein [unclassified Streptomyces]|uniref:hypothetical protein n=1 Tax=unclassified Streptomyces TaxID=2593676 RepID=UPI0001C1BB5C|nr:MULTISPECIES: hypothetical protein [unclassified Streptomyces]AEN12033.1 conserved hypothetical protein [Streptomyces sp. SirexAA-E]MYR66680.1 hypothetical protein [Streptomyces sp. SID4939]MYS03181.1 hypothetical protein [Streptomyces sp. SID4940]MYT66926.1 hypothetical protein [Streptomyces sp. SID8357]MYT88297.1 hypothetical protein [Streptomyces sp. SID8360]
MSTSQTTQFVRLRVDLVLEITDAEALTGTALETLAAERVASAASAPGAPDGDPAEGGTHADEAVGEDAAEAVAALVDPFDLVGEMPGVELAQASWDSEVIDYDPDAEDWTVGDDEDDAFYGIEDNGTDDEEAVDVTQR